MGDDDKVKRFEITDQDLEDDKGEEKHYCSCWIFVRGGIMIQTKKKDKEEQKESTGRRDE